MSEGFIPKMHLLCFLLAVLFVSSPARAQSSSTPTVTSISVPFYPPLARAANIECVIHVKVTTDGNRTVTAQAEDGQKLLADAAEQNVRTWQFESQRPTTFTVAYRYKIVTDLPEQGRPKVILELPYNIDVEILRWPGTHDESPSLQKPQQERR